MRGPSIGTDEQRIGLQGPIPCPDGCTEGMTSVPMQRAATIQTKAEVVTVFEEYVCPSCGQRRQLSHGSRGIL